ncbi:MAG: NAD(P)/FAD-dependent oxidoreductase, partial [Flavobacteriales bacterium]
NGDWKLACYKNEVMRAPYTRHILKNAEIIQELMVVSNYSYSITKKFDTNYVVLGDSASFLDPIFATGVYIAMKSVFITVPAIDKILKGDDEKGMKEMAVAIDFYEGAISFVDRFLRMFYNFSNVNLAELSKHLNPEFEKVRADKEIIFSLLHFLMGGDFFENYKMYEEYLSFIETPKQLARYQHYVMNRDLYKEAGCPMPYDLIFPMAKVGV